MLSILLLGAIGLLGALLLYWGASKFHVEENPLRGEVLEALPGANCGGCGFAGCGGFADKLVKSDSLDDLNCPAGGAETMSRIAAILGKEAVAAKPNIAVVRCNGSCDNRKRTNIYNGVKSCKIESRLYGGETACSYGCLGYGDCVVVCPFDAIHMNPETRLPEVNEDKCTACGKCVKACPKLLIELRKKGPKSRRIYVSCRNEDKPAVAKKACEVACISCKKCMKACPFEAITIENNLAFIHDDKCRLCRKCVPECPTAAIVELNFPVKKDVENV